MGNRMTESLYFHFGDPQRCRMLRPGATRTTAFRLTAIMRKHLNAFPSLDS
jgi:hypothetical protein